MSLSVFYKNFQFLTLEAFTSQGPENTITRLVRKNAFLLMKCSQMHC